MIFLKGPNYVGRKQISGCRGLGMEEKLTAKGLGGTFQGDRMVLYLDCGGGYVTVCTCQNSQTVHFKKVNFLYINYTFVKRQHSCCREEDLIGLEDNLKSSIDKRGNDRVSTRVWQ
jgi:hypothetical protein